MATISTRITLEGADEIKKQLKDLGNEGEAALEQISKASEDTGFEQLGKESESAAEGIAKAGEASRQTGQELDKVKDATDKASESMSRLSLETVKTSSEIAKNVFQIAKTGVEITQLVRTHESWIKSMINVAAHVSTTVRAVALLTSVLSTAAVALGVTAAAIGGAVIALEALGKAAAAAASPYEKLNDTLQMLSRSSGQSFASLQRGEALFKQIGLSAETFRGSVSKIGEALGKLDISDELKKSADSIVEANRNVLEAERAVIQQRLEGRRVFLIGEDDRLGQRVVDLQHLKRIQAELTSETDKAREANDKWLAAQQKLAEKQANSLSKVLEQVKAIEAGQKGITFDSLVTAETKVTAFAISMKQAQDAGQQAGVTLVQFIAAADRASAIQIGKQFNVSEEQVDRIQRIGGGLKTVEEIQKRIGSVGTLISPATSAALAEMKVKIEANENAWERLNQAWSSSVFAGVSAKILSILTSIETALVNMAARVLETFGQLGGQAALIGAIGTAFTALALIIGGIPAAIVLLVAAIGTVVVALSGISWESFGAAAMTAWNGIIEVIGKAIGAVGQFVTSIATIVWDTISGAGVAAWNAVTRAINNTIAAVARLIGLQGPRGGAPASSSVPGHARGGMIGGRGTGTSDSNLAWLSRGEYVVPAGAVRRPGVLAFLEALRRSGGLSSRSKSKAGIPGFAEGGLISEVGVAAIKGMDAFFKESLEAFRQKWDDMVPGGRLGSLTEFNRKWDDMVAGGRMMTDKMNDTTNALADVGTEMEQLGNWFKESLEAFRRRWDDMVPPMSGGGLLGGRGSGTSDSNLAWVSRGEHIMPARAVAQPGVLAFLEMLRHSGGDLSRVLDRMGHFATGGLVAMPAFAAGGGVGGMSHVTIQFPGLPAIGGLRASSQVVDELQRAAAMAQVRSGGRKPSRYT